MDYRNFLRHIPLLFLGFVMYAEETNSDSNSSLNLVDTMTNPATENNTDHNHVHKSVLSNGMTVLTRVVRTIPKVSLQIWYNVGSKNERAGEKGIAHLIEHMIFKGTEEMLSESDINDVTHMLSGSCNAFTSYDYTGYLFNMPTQHWKDMLPIMADCMENARFDKEMLASEMKAVIQELKMYKDHYVRSMIEELVSIVFSHHPYSYPIIGFKQDLWNAKSECSCYFIKNIIIQTMPP